MFRTIPIVGIIADKIRCVIFTAGLTIPVMRTVCFGRIDALTTFPVAVTVTAVRTLRQRRCVFLLAPRTMPIMRTTGAGRLRIAAADFAIPGAVANNIGRVPIVVRRTPPGMRTICFRLINSIAIFLIAITAFFIAHIGIFVSEVMLGTIPGFILFAVADGIFIRIVCRLADFAVPVTLRALLNKSMRFVAFRTIPTVLAMFYVFGRMVRLFLRTVPTVRTTFRCGMHPAFGAAIPVSVRANGIQGMMRVARSAPPIIIAIFILFQLFFAGVAEHCFAGANFIDCEGQFAGFASPAMRAMFG